MDVSDDDYFKYRIKSARIPASYDDFLIQNNISFTQLVTDAIKEKMQVLNKEKRRNHIKNYSTYMIWICLGAIFFFLTLSSPTLLYGIVAFLLGTFMIAYGGINLYLEVTK